MKLFYTFEVYKGRNNNHKPKPQNKMKNLFFVCLPPVEKDDTFSMLLPVSDMKEAKEVQNDIGGTIRVMQIYFN